MSNVQTWPGPFYDIGQAVRITQRNDPYYGEYGVVHAQSSFPGLWLIHLPNVTNIPSYKPYIRRLPYLDFEPVQSTI